MPDNPSAVVPAGQTVPVSANAPVAMASASSNGLGNGWAKILANMTAVGVIMVFSYLMLSQILDSAKTAQELLREGQKEHGQKLGDMVDELKEVKRGSQENHKLMKESAESLDKTSKALSQIALELNRSLPAFPKSGDKPGD